MQTARADNYIFTTDNTESVQQNDIASFDLRAGKRLMTMALFVSVCALPPSERLTGKKKNC
jgi:hypothetical protein